MNNFKKYIRKNSTIAEMVILFTGIILILIGERLAFSVLLGVGSSIVASAVVVFMTDVFLGGDDREIVKQWGLESVYRTRGEMNSSCDVYLKKARFLNIIAFGLKSFRETQQKQVERILKNGGNIRIITMRPHCNNLKEREKDEMLPEDGISLSIEQLINWAKQLNDKHYKGKVELRWHEHQPVDFLFMMDNRLFCGPYEFGKDSQQSVSFEYNNSGTAYEYYRNQFNKLWNDKDFCSDVFRKQ